MNLFRDADLNFVLHNAFNKICNEEAEYEGRGNGWSLYRVDGMMRKINRYRPLGGSSFYHCQKVLPIKMMLLFQQTLMNNVSNSQCYAILSKVRIDLELIISIILCITNSTLIALNSQHPKNKYQNLRK